MAYRPTRDEAFELLKEYNQSESLLNHALAVEAVMRYFSQLYNEDIDK
jgi:predicted hydrolase (HD superfamily)